MVFRSLRMEGVDLLTTGNLVCLFLFFIFVLVVTREGLRVLERVEREVMLNWYEMYQTELLDKRKVRIVIAIQQ